jgi:hypothetical protein
MAPLKNVPALRGAESSDRLHAAVQKPQLMLQQNMFKEDDCIELSDHKKQEKPQARLNHKAHSE